MRRQGAGELSQRGRPSGATALARGVRQLSAAETPLWLAAVVLYGVGDFVTSSVGIGTGRAAEAGPVAVGLVDHYGLVGLLALKVGTFALAYAVWRLARASDRVAVPLALVVVGAAVTLWNLLVLL